MHELSITQSVVDAVIERMDGATVTAIELEIGKLSGVEPDSVRFCFELVAGGTALDGARLDIVEPAGEGRCRDCGTLSKFDDRIVLCSCGSGDVDVLSGTQLRIRSVEVV